MALGFAHHGDEAIVGNRGSKIYALALGAPFTHTTKSCRFRVVMPLKRRVIRRQGIVVKELSLMNLSPDAFLRMRNKDQS
jgi:hypothetical protein